MRLVPPGLSGRGKLLDGNDDLRSHGQEVLIACYPDVRHAECVIPAGSGVLAQGVPPPIDPRPLALLMSVSPVWAHAIARGRKTVEVRRRPPDIHAPLPMLLYATAPERAVVCYCMATCTIRAVPDWLWRLAGGRSALTRTAFDTYLAGAPNPGVIEIVDPKRCHVPLGFRAPQSWMYLRAEYKGHLALLDASASAARSLAP